MPQAIKVVNYSGSSGVTHYTCPASTCAKVLISHIVLDSGGSGGDLSLNVGGITYRAHTGVSSILQFNAGETKTAVGITQMTVPAGGPIEHYLAAGNNISHTSTSGATLRLHMVIIEEAAS